MEARALALHDVPRICWQRKRAWLLDSERHLAWGHPLTCRNLLAALQRKPECIVAVHGGSPWGAAGLLAKKEAGDDLARLQFVLPASDQVQPMVAAQLGMWLGQAAWAQRCQWMQAAAPARTPQEAWLRAADFRPVAWQQTEICLDEFSRLPRALTWQPMRAADRAPVRALLAAVLPTQLRLLEPIRAAGWVCWRQKELLGYAHLVHGRQAVIVRPLLRPVASVEPAQLLAGLLAALRQYSHGPFLLQVRSYQAWLLPALASWTRPYWPQELIFLRGTSQAVAVTESLAERWAAPAPLS